MNISNLKSISLKNLNGYWGIAIVASIISALSSSNLEVNGRQLLEFPFGLQLVLSIFLFNVILVGLSYLHLRIDDNTATLGDLFNGFKNGKYMNNVVTMLLNMVYLFLWFLLLIIPGIIKAFSYALVPFILADDDLTVDGNDAITLSRRWMDGHKIELFVLGLSFIGWILLIILLFVAISFGSIISGIFSIIILLVAFAFLNVYMMQAFTQFYLEIKARYISNDVIEESTIIDEF